LYSPWPNYFVIAHGACILSGIANEVGIVTSTSITDRRNL
jgi:hypothetical protein